MRKLLSIKTYIICMLALTFMVLTSVFIIKDINVTKHYLQNALTNQAQNTATSLGLSIAPFISVEEFTIAQTMAKASFDSGYYAKLTFVGAQPELSFSYEHKTKPQDVPHWFIEFIDLAPKTVTKEVSNGWFIAGTLAVQAHPGSAYSALYTQIKQTLFSSLAVITLLALLLMFVAQAYKKLTVAIYMHAKNISKNSTSHLQHKSNFKEFNHVVKALNHYIMHFQKLLLNKDQKIALLRQEVYTDELTGFANRKALLRDFDKQFEAIQATDQQYYFGLVSLSELRAVNQNKGHSAGDEYIMQSAKLILEATELFDNLKVYKLSGSEFVLLGQLTAKQAGFLIDQLRQAFSAFTIAQHGVQISKPILIKVHKNERVQALLMRIDSHISKEKHFDQVMPLVDETLSGKTKQQWHSILTDYTSLIDVIEVATHFSDTLLDESLAAYEQIFDISVQPVLNAQQNTEYLELFIRFKHQDDILSTSDVFAMAERYGFVLSLERAVVSYILQKIKTIKHTPVAINISNCSLYDHNFNDWLFDILPEIQHQLPPLIFEVNESALVYSANVCRDFINRAKDHDIKVTLDRFGTSFSSFQYIQNLRIDYVKIDGSLIKNCENTDFRFFVNTVTTLCHGINVKVIAAHVETQDSADLCMLMKIDALQGLGVVPVSRYTDYIERKNGTVCQAASGANI